MKVRNYCSKYNSNILSVIALVVSIISVFYSYTQNKLMKEQNLIANQQNELAEKQISMLIDEGNPIFNINCSEEIIDAIHNENEKYKELPKFEILNFGKPCKNIYIYIDPRITFYCDTTQISVSFDSPYSKKYINEKQINLVPEVEDFWIDSFDAINNDIYVYQKKYGEKISYEINYFIKIEYKDFNNKSGTKYWVRCNMGGSGIYNGFVDEDLYKKYSHKYFSFEISEKPWYKNGHINLDNIVEIAQIYNFGMNYKFIHK